MVKVIFGDQYGRLWDTNLPAEYFISRVEFGDGIIPFSGQPFLSDVLGSPIDFGDLEMPQKIMLKVDQKTIRNRQGSLYTVFADVINLDGSDFAFAPRTLLKQQVEKHRSELDKLKVALSLTSTLHYQLNKTDDTQIQPRGGIDGGIITSSFSTHQNITDQLVNNLRAFGVPLSHIENLSPQKLKLYLLEKQAEKRSHLDYLEMADAYQMKKSLLKFICYSNNYDVGLVAMGGGGSTNELDLVAPNLVDSTILDRLFKSKSRVQFLFPTLNSARKLAQNGGFDTILA